MLQQNQDLLLALADGQAKRSQHFKKEEAQSGRQ
jgi:hypothetical protein